MPFGECPRCGSGEEEHVCAVPLIEALERLMVVGSAATGFLMCDFSDMHGYIEKMMGRPVYTHEMGTGPTANKIRELAKPDFVAAITAAQAALLAAQKATA